MPEDHKPMPIPGYTAQADENVQLVSVNKVLEERVLRQIDFIQSLSDIDKRWVDIAREHIEQGFMALNRAVFQPQRIEGDLPNYRETE